MNPGEISLHYPSLKFAGIGADTTERVFGYSPDESPSKAKILTGSLSFDTASAAVTGTGTALDTELQVGDWIKLSADPTSAYSQILAIADATNLTLRHNYRGPLTAAGASVAVPSQLVRAADLIADAAGVFVRLEDRLGEAAVAGGADPNAFLLPANLVVPIIGRHRFVRVIMASGSANVYAIGKW